jgi:hypothetical protein
MRTNIEKHARPLSGLGQKAGHFLSALAVVYEVILELLEELARYSKPNVRRDAHGAIGFD